MTELLFPAHVTALRLTRARRVYGPPSDYEIVPWFDDTRDHNGSVPNLASAISAEPFSEHQTWLNKGVHLHWTLPDGLKRGATRRSAVRSIKVGDLWMPPAPNRWLVVRQTLTTQEGSTAANKAWLVESDYVHPGSTRPNAWAIAYPRTKRAQKRPPYLYLGRQIELDPHTWEAKAANPKLFSGRTSLAHYGDTLTALGPGDPLFAAHYPSCKSVFGLHDADPAPSDQSVQYEVFGWYSEEVTDPLAAMVLAMYQDPKTAISRVMNDAHTKGRDAGLDANHAKFTNAQWRKLGKAHLEEQFSVAIADEIDIPDRILCHARTHILPDMAGDDSNVHDAGPIGIGSSAPEAFAALLAGTAGNTLDESMENRLVQSLAATDLIEHPLDLDQKLKEARHNEQFKGFAGHKIWVVRPKQGTDDGTPGGLAMPEDLAHEINQLNVLQEEFDRKSETINGLRQELFSDWHRFMRAVYPEGDVDPFAFDVNGCRQLMDRTRLMPLEELIWETGRLFQAETDEGDMLISDQWLGQLAPEILKPTPFSYGLAAGYDEGDVFADTAEAGQRLTGVRIYAGSIVDAIAITTARDLPRRGGRGGNTHEFWLEDGEHVSAIFGESVDWFGDNVISRLGIETNTGRVMPLVGLPHANSLAFRFEAPGGHMVTGLRGRASSYLRSIGIIVTPLHTTTSETATESNHDFNPHSFAARLVQQHQVVLSRLKIGLRGTTKLHIALVPGPRYWQPNDPVIVLNDSHVRTRDRHGHDGEYVHTRGSTSARSAAIVFTLASGWGKSDKKVLADPDFLAGVGAGDFLEGKNLSWAATQGHEAWNPVQLEWEVEIRPLARHGNTASGAYRENFVTESQQMRAGHPDLEPALKTSHTAQTYRYIAGRSILNPSAGLLMMKRLGSLAEPLKQLVNATAHKKTPMILPLGGFNDQLLMLRPEPQLEIDDSIGLPHQRDLARRVSTALDGFHPNTPMQNHAFNPIRSGTLSIGRLRVIDTFGRTRDWRPKTVQTTLRMQAAKSAVATARLPVRLSQPARLNFRWLSAANSDIESNVHPATSPICGWVLPNDLDGALGIYARSGRMLGNVVSGSVWQPAPGDDLAPRSWRDIPDAHLARVVGWLTAPTTVDFTGKFLEMLDSALAMIDPLDAASHQARALLIGRPLALVRARLSLSFLHQAALDQSNRAYMTRLAGGVDDDHGFTDVKFPVRLGEYGQLNDGLCGYWIETEESFAGDEFYMPLSLETELVDRIKVTSGTSLTDAALSLSMNSAPVSVSMLVDPRGSVHATTGILPTKSISIPPDQYHDQISALRATFRTAPVLTPMEQVEIPLPSEPGFSWSWLERQEHTWVDIPHHATIRKEQILAAFGANGAALWDSLIEHNRIMLEDQPDEGVLMPGDQNAAADRFDDIGLTVELVERGLHALSQSIEDVKRRALFRGRPVAREGWLELRSVPESRQNVGAEDDEHLTIDWGETT